jgi:hypothetical protein
MYSLNEKLRLESILKSAIQWRKKIKILAWQIRRLERKKRSAGRRPNRRIACNQHRTRGYPLEELAHLNEQTFKRMFRVDRATFDMLVDKLTPLISRDETYATNSSGQPISVSTRLPVTLRWLAGGSYNDFVNLLQRESTAIEAVYDWPSRKRLESYQLVSASTLEEC